MKKFNVLCALIFCFFYKTNAQVLTEFILDSKLTVKAELIYSNDFNKGIGDWITEKADNTSGSVTIINEKIDISVAGGTTVWCTKKVSGPVIIEYDAIVVGEGGPNDRVSDLNCYWMAMDPNSPNDFFLNSTQRQGDASSLTLYYTGLGGYTNTKTRFRRFNGIDNPLLPEHDLSAPEFLITANAVNHIKLVAYNNMIRYYRNDQLIYDFYDASPYTEGYFGFRTTKNHMTADNFRIYSIVECDNTKPRLEAECYSSMYGIQTENCSEGTKNVGYINNGDWLAFNNINLTGMKSIKARVSGKTNGSTIEVRTGSQTGTLIATIPVSNTGGNQTWVTDSINLAAVTGTQNVYLVFKGTGTGYLYNLNWFGFSDKVNIVTGFEDVNNIDGVMIYPNPFSNKFIVQTNSTSSSKLEVLNTLGQLVISQTTQENNTEIDLSNENSGLYIVKISNENNVITREILKK